MSDDGTAEAIATTGLFLIFISVIAVAVCLASWAGDGALTALSGAVAVISFAASIACFRAQADEQDQEAPAN
jgi:membrane protein implicated in regulation of membrane protease activity